MNLSQVNLFVEDFPSMLRFYRDALGFHAKNIDPGPPSIPMVNWVSLRTGDVSVELFDATTFWDTSLLRRANRDAVQLCFIVDSVQRECVRLSDAGVECGPIVSEDWGEYSSFRDPEGNWLQIFEVRDRTNERLPG
ncbi:MAG TPA: VOC family protein [Acidimicrobiales bacterium]|nr:VOC family protein [Acidimicrobiales bacterium]